MLIFNAVPPEILKVTSIQCWFWAMPLQAEISPNLFMTLWHVDGEISEIWWKSGEIPFLKCVLGHVVLKLFS